MRLTAWYFLVLCLAFGVFSLLAFFEVRGSIHSAVDEGLRDRAADVRELLGRQWPSEQVKRELAAGSSVRGEDDILQIAETRGEWEYSSVSAVRYALPMVRPPRTGEKFQFSTVYSKGMPLRVLNGQLRTADRAYDVQIAAPMDDFYEAVNRFRLVLLFSLPVLLLVASAGGYWLSRKAVAPVGEIARAAHSISEHELSRRLPILQTGDELQSLSETLNETFGRLERAFKRVTQFTADASHELRTPVALMRTRTELALRKPRSEADYRETIVSIHQELERTSALIENLMTLARADSGSEVLQAVPTNLNEVLLEISEPARLLAERESIHYVQRLPETPLTINGNAPSLRRLFLILIENAVKYTPREGRVSLVLTACNGAAVTEIRDTGVGISSSDVPHIFERFYRADASRSRESGGPGLGLSIAKWIADAHEGKISVTSNVGEGSIFKVEIPLSEDGILGEGTRCASAHVGVRLASIPPKLS
jgi:heavy metal sensor kinase